MGLPGPQGTLRNDLVGRTHAPGRKRGLDGCQQLAKVGGVEDGKMPVASVVRSVRHQLVNLLHLARLSFLPKSHGEIRVVFKQVRFRAVVGEHRWNHLVPNAHSPGIDVAVIAHHVN